jgi:hypothetical protein
MDQPRVAGGPADGLVEGDLDELSAVAGLAKLQATKALHLSDSGAGVHDEDGRHLNLDGGVVHERDGSRGMAHLSNAAAVLWLEHGSNLRVHREVRGALLRKSGRWRGSVFDALIRCGRRCRACRGR